MKKILLILLLFGANAYAGQEMTCPDLKDPNITLAEWEIHGRIQSAEFSHVLISRIKVMGQSSVICKYSKELSLSQRGTFQQGSTIGMWQVTNLGGISFYQCLALRKECFFYGLP